MPRNRCKRNIIRNKTSGTSVDPQEDLSPDEQKELEEACKSVQREFADNLERLKKWTTNDFILCSNIGEGRFGKVHAAVEKGNDRRVAIKVIDKVQIEKDGMGQQLVNEIIIHSNARHKYIVPLYTFFAEGKFLYLVMELEKSGSLYEFMEGQPMRKVLQELVAKFISQIAQALLFLHSLHFMHRDVKPENILLDHNLNAKLADFGWSVPTALLPSEICGTVDYMAPEMLKNKVYGRAVDNWCLGVLCFELLNGFSPFHSRERPTSESNDFETFSNIIKGQYQCPDDMPPGAQDLVGKLLKSNPSKRLPLENVISHTWIKALYCAETA